MQYPKAFVDAFQFIVMNPEIEGGAKYTNDPRDPGGPTKYGITLRFLKLIHHRPLLLNEEYVRNLSEAEAMEVYYKHFWLEFKCDQLPPSIGLAMFDGCINQNAQDLEKYLQRALGVEPDGVIGPKTLAKAKTCDQKRVLKEFMALRALRYALSPNDKVFGHGWFRRCFDIHRRALELV